MATPRAGCRTPAARLVGPFSQVVGGYPSLPQHTPDPNPVSLARSFPGCLPRPQCLPLHNSESCLKCKNAEPKKLLPGSPTQESPGRATPLQVHLGSPALQPYTGIPPHHQQSPPLEHLPMLLLFCLLLLQKGAPPNSPVRKAPTGRTRVAGRPWVSRVATVKG